MTFNRINSLTSWNPDARVLEKLNGTGFENLHKLAVSDFKDTSLVEAFVQFYNVDEGCFVFNGHKLILSLQDVRYITGSPVNGNAVTGVDGNARDLCHRHLGSELNSEEGFSKSMVKTGWLRENYEKLDDNVNEEKIAQHTRAYVLVLTGYFIVPFSKGKFVPAMYLSLLENLEEIKDYAWGAALLAHLMCSIENFRRERARCLQGSFYIFMVSIDSHFR